MNKRKEGRKGAFAAGNSTDGNIVESLDGFVSPRRDRYLSSGMEHHPEQLLGSRFDESSLIEGVSNQVLLTLAITITMLGGLATFLYRTEHQNIHPENRERVRELRQHLQTEALNYQDGFERERPQFYNDMSCPVCLQQAAFPVETNCGHLFCGSCIVAYWTYGTWLGAVNCPICRQMVTLLFPLFPVNDEQQESMEVIQNINDYNRRFSGQPRSTSHRFADELSPEVKIRKSKDELMMKLYRK
ncbi:E3 ubiquitin-protein ligase RNF170-like isoform X3 [Scyliorhinus torazame]|uniref:E3 ubiquitin-protein ligase RNF170-like isoform X3 n=1 Tax=Scyliorhinus torazame TaxID=75743 RepID=UPI003B59BCDD